jgi:hypothetical protein
MRTLTRARLLLKVCPISTHTHARQSIELPHILPFSNFGIDATPLSITPIGGFCDHDTWPHGREKRRVCISPFCIIFFLPADDGEVAGCGTARFKSWPALRAHVSHDAMRMQNLKGMDQDKVSPQFSHLWRPSFINSHDQGWKIPSQGTASVCMSWFGQS